jgi:hypothetical protein
VEQPSDCLDVMESCQPNQGLCLTGHLATVAIDSRTFLDTAPTGSSRRSDNRRGSCGQLSEQLCGEAE